MHFTYTKYGRVVLRMDERRVVVVDRDPVRRALRCRFTYSVFTTSADFCRKIGVVGEGVGELAVVGRTRWSVYTFDTPLGRREVVVTTTSHIVTF